MGDKTKPKKGKKKVVIIVLVVLVVVAAIIGSSVKKMTSQVATAVNTVEVEPVQKRDLSDTISLKGTVSGITKNNATSKALAEITAVNVQVGDIVKEGDVLCTLDSSTIQDQIADLEKNMSDTNAVLIHSRQQKQSVVQKKISRHSLQLHRKQLMMQRMLITHRVLCGIRVKINRMQNFSLC